MLESSDFYVNYLEFDAETKTTRTALERVPEDKKDFAPHPKSMPLNKLAPHVAELAGFGAYGPDHPGTRFLQKQLASAYLLSPRNNWCRSSTKAQPRFARP